MKENKFTQGKWKAMDGHSGSDVVAFVTCNDATVASCRRINVSDEEGKANAKLISAAPELLSALQSLLIFSKAEVPEKYHSEYAKVWEPAVEAIKKATE